MGEPQRALELYEQSLGIYKEIRDRRGEGLVLWNISLALDQIGDRPRAIAQAEESLKIYEEIEIPNAAKVRQKLDEWRDEM